jgi:hypothetical protein
MSLFRFIFGTFIIIALSNAGFGQQSNADSTDDSVTVQIQHDLTSLTNEAKNLRNRLGAVEWSTTALGLTQRAFNDSILWRLKELANELAEMKKMQTEVTTRMDTLNAYTVGHLTDMRSSLLRSIWITTAALVVLVLVVFIRFSRTMRRTNLSKLSFSENTTAGTEPSSVAEKQVSSNQPEQTKTTTHRPLPDLGHSFPIKVGEEIYRMRFRVQRMDENTKGLDAIKHTLSRLEGELNALGYTIRDLTGQAYNEGMNSLVKIWEPYDDIAPGEQKIVRMIKPQILYKDVVVSPGEIVVGIRSSK